MSTQRDYYEILSISKSASGEEIKKSYRRMAMKHHPDRNPDDHQAATRFKEVQEAYEVLSDSQKRSAYDQFGHAGVNQGAGGGFGGFNFQDMGDVFGDIFGDIFGGGRGGREKAQQGSDLGYELVLTLEEAVAGVTKEIKVPTWVGCKPCDGSGAKPGKSPVSCKQCQGSGQVRISHGFIQVQQTCPVCRGAGKMIEDPCSSCRGQGRVQERKTLSVKVPMGVDTGDRIRLNGEGEAGLNGAPAGDLYVQMQVKDHEIFHRDGTDLHCEVPISFVQAALGAEIDVPTLQNGAVKLKIPAETQSDKKFRLRGKGIKALRTNGTGDLICHVRIETPVHLTPEQKELLKQFESSMQKDLKKHSPVSKHWLDTVKEFFQ